MPKAMSEFRETAEVRETADARTFSEEEHTAILADRLERETASLAKEKTDLEARIEDLQAEKAALVTERDEALGKVDVAEAEKAAAEQAFEDYKAQITADAEKAERLASRTEEIKQAAPGLPDEFFTEERAQRWADMDEAAFDEVKAAIQATAPEKAKRGAPRETAMSGNATTPKGDTEKSSGLYNFMKKGK